MSDLTPMLRQYLDIKKMYPGTLLMFRLGDFYELFNEDAIVGARELEITLTARQKDSKNPIPMCGVPYHAASGYISKLVRKGYRVAICEQAEASTKGTKLVRREVVRVVTPGTSFDPQAVDAKAPVYLAAVCGSENIVGAAFLDLSTGEFAATQVTGSDAWPRIRDILESYSPREILYPESITDPTAILNSGKRSDELLPYGGDGADNARSGPLLTALEDRHFDASTGRDELAAQFGTRDLAAFGLEEKPESIRAAFACLAYARTTQRSQAEHISSISYFESADFMVLDPLTLRNLEVVQSNSGQVRRSLFDVIDETVTGMGGRLLRAWLLRPSVKRTEVQTRLSAVAELLDPMLRQSVRHLLKGISDLERLAGRLSLATATARDLLALKDSLDKVPALQARLGDASSLLLQVLAENIFGLSDARELIGRSIADEPPANLNDGNTIRRGFDPELDELRDLSSSVKNTIAQFEGRERERTGISNLKVRFNNVFGYYLEISKANVSRVPADYERRQTLANAERYTTPELKDWEGKVLGAEQRIQELESRLFKEIVDKLRLEVGRLQTTARALATLDVLAGLAETASRRNYASPILHDGDEIEIKSGRHPTVEAFSRENFIPNDIYLNNSTDRLLIVTGPNMGGKSTILRQVALIQVLAQIGSFVPASAARLPVLDRIWTRVGASDDLASGRSTFMVEMTETAAILRNATPRSLVLLDEIGRGTSTFDGLSIAWAVAEYLHDAPEHSAKTIFATHYHELTELAEKLPGARNYEISAAERDGELVFLHKLQKGKASKSYGIAVARLAGLPQSVIERAKEVLERLQRYEVAVFANHPAPGSAARRAAAVQQATLFSSANDLLADELRQAPIETMTPEEARSFLVGLRRLVP